MLRESNVYSCVCLFTVGGRGTSPKPLANASSHNFLTNSCAQARKHASEGSTLALKSRAEVTRIQNRGNSGPRKGLMSLLIKKNFLTLLTLTTFFQNTKLKTLSSSCLRNRAYMTLLVAQGLKFQNKYDILLSFLVAVEIQTMFASNLVHLFKYSAAASL